MVRMYQLRPGYENLTVEKARIIAHLIADGCSMKIGSNYWIKYSSNEQQQLNEFSDDLQKVYGLSTKLVLERSGKTGKLLPYVFARSKLAFIDLHTYTQSYSSYEWKLPEQIKNSDQNIMIAFLKAFFDDEGTVYMQGNKVVVRAYSVNKQGLLELKHMLDSLRINTILREGFGARRNVYGLEIVEASTYEKIVGFRLHRKKEKLVECLRRGKPP